MLKAMTETIQIPKILIYEEFDGHPIYRKGYRDFMLGLKTVEEISMGTSTLQWFITSSLNKFLIKYLPDNYLCGSGELGLHLSNKTNFSADIAIYREGQLKVGFHSVKYEQKPPNVIIEVDIKIDESDYFQNEEEYFHKKTEKLLQWGVEKVIWVFSSSRRVLIADNLQKWEFNSWDIPFIVIDDIEMNVWELMLKSGFEVGEK
jgi:Uma2 family endonuclease